MILEIKSPDEKLLYQPIEDFDFANPPCNPVQLANDLIETMAANKGLGLAANQCGLPYRAFALWSEQPLVCFNPRIIDQTTEGVMLEEGCLTFPNLFVKIRRPKIIKVRYQDATGEVHTDKFIGMTARGFQHELDHLDGVMFTRRALGPHLARALNQQKQLSRKFKRGEVYYKPSELPAVETTPSGTLTFKTE